ncbi:unnamed protein product [Ectocarpus sp. 12 AP-2014]
MALPLDRRLKLDFSTTKWVRREPDTSAESPRRHASKTAIYCCGGTIFGVKHSSFETRSRGGAILPPLTEYHGTVYGTVYTVLAVKQSSFESRSREVLSLRLLRHTTVRYTVRYRQSWS